MVEMFNLFGTEKRQREPISSSKQKQLLIKAKGKCEKCGKNLLGLKPFIHHKDGNRSNNKPSNLMVLCPDCHYSDDLHVFKTVVKHDIFGLPYKERKLVTKKIKKAETSLKISMKTKKEKGLVKCSDCIYLSKSLSGANLCNYSFVLKEVKPRIMRKCSNFSPKSKK